MKRDERKKEMLCTTVLGPLAGRIAVRLAGRYVDTLVRCIVLRSKDVFTRKRKAVLQDNLPFQCPTTLDQTGIY